MGSGAGEALVGAWLWLSPRTPTHPTPAAQLLAVKLRPDLPSAASEVLCAWRPASASRRARFALTVYTHMHTHAPLSLPQTHRLTHPGLRNTQARRAGTPSFTHQGRGREGLGRDQAGRPGDGSRIMMPGTFF